MIEPTNFVVRVSCMTYNHASFIIDAMNGFVMQVTKFPFVCTIVDDASTDGEQKVIREYVIENFDIMDYSVSYDKVTDYGHVTFAQHKTNKNCFFAVICLKENHYSQRKSKDSYLTEWMDTKYIALCEGDDYWTDPLKLQKQVGFMDEHEDCSMTCSRIRQFSESDMQFVEDYACYDKNQYVDVVDVIEKGGLFIPTCSIVYRPEIMDNYPDYCKNCHVGDYPKQILAAMKGRIYFFNEAMAVYRINNPSSWVGRFAKEGHERYWAGIKSEIRMLLGFSTDYPKYKTSFENRIKNYIRCAIPDVNQNVELFRYYKEEIGRLSLKSRMELFYDRSRFKRVCARLKRKM